MRDLDVSMPPTAPLPAGVVCNRPADLDTGVYHLPIMEAEVTFRIGADLPPRDAVLARRGVRCGRAHIAIEAANFPFADGPAAGIPSIIAAGFAVANLIVGPEIEDGRDRDSERTTSNCSSTTRSPRTASRATHDVIRLACYWPW